MSMEPSLSTILKSIEMRHNPPVQKSLGRVLHELTAYTVNDLEAETIVAELKERDSPFTDSFSEKYESVRSGRRLVRSHHGGDEPRFAMRAVEWGSDQSMTLDDVSYVIDSKGDVRSFRGIDRKHNRGGRIEIAGFDIVAPGSELEQTWHRSFRARDGTLIGVLGAANYVIAPDGRYLTSGQHAILRTPDGDLHAIAGASKFKPRAPRSFVEFDERAKSSSWWDHVKEMFGQGSSQRASVNHGYSSQNNRGDREHDGSVYASVNSLQPALDLLSRI